MKVKLIQSRNYLDLEKAINEWLANNTGAYIKDIKFVSAPVTRTNTDSNLVVCIVYQEG